MCCWSRVCNFVLYKKRRRACNKQYSTVKCLFSQEQKGLNAFWSVVQSLNHWSSTSTVQPWNWITESWITESRITESRIMSFFIKWGKDFKHDSGWVNYPDSSRLFLVSLRPPLNLLPSTTLPWVCRVAVKAAPGWRWWFERRFPKLGICGATSWSWAMRFRSRYVAITGYSLEFCSRLFCLNCTLQVRRCRVFGATLSVFSAL